MNKWALITPIEQVEYKQNGYILLKEDKIKCGDCNKLLIEIIKVKDNDGVKEIEALCPYCGGSSFLYRIEGETFFQACDPLCINNIETDFINNITRMKVELTQ